MVGPSENSPPSTRFVPGRAREDGVSLANRFIAVLATFHKRTLRRKDMSSFIKKFVKDEDGATMVEYGLMVALIAVVLIAVVTLVGQSLSQMFSDVNTAIGGT
jgi:pilus assembly protein Flp/PilA